MGFWNRIRQLIGAGLVAAGEFVRGIGERLIGRSPAPPETQPGGPQPPQEVMDQGRELVETGERVPIVVRQIEGGLAPPVRSPGNILTLQPGESPPVYAGRGMVPPGGQLYGRFRYEVEVPYRSTDDQYQSVFRMVVWSEQHLTWLELYQRVSDRINQIYYEYGKNFGGYELNQLVFAQQILVQAFDFYQ
jgi:hypothetical protein